MYLFGASPAVCASFLQGRDHRLEPLGERSLYLPWATSLRMSDLGYNNNAQSGLNICYNSLDNYIASMLNAISLPYEPYAQLGTHDAKGEWQQLNTNLLQIENEFYSPIRPKRVANSGEKPVHALRERGWNTSRSAAWTSTPSCRWALSRKPPTSWMPSCCSVH